MFVPGCSHWASKSANQQQAEVLPKSTKDDKARLPEIGVTDLTELRQAVLNMSTHCHAKFTSCLPIKAVGSVRLARQTRPESWALLLA